MDRAATEAFTKAGRSLGLSVETLRKWHDRGDIKLAPIDNGWKLDIERDNSEASAQLAGAATPWGGRRLA